MITMRILGIVNLFIVGSTIIGASAQSTLPKAEHDSLWAVWSDPAQADTIRLEAIYTLAWDGYLYSQPDSAWYFSQLQYDFASANGLHGYMGRALNLQGTTFLNRGDYPKALDHFRRSLQVFEASGNKMGLSSSLNSLGTLYLNLGDHPKALDYYQQSLKINEELGDPMRVGSVMNNIGVLYTEIGNYPKALEYYQRSLALTEESPSLLNNIGIIYDHQGDYEKALEHYFRGLKLSEGIGDIRSMGRALLNIGSCQQTTGEYDTSLVYLKRALDAVLAIDDNVMVAMVYRAMGNNYYLKKKYGEALAWCTISRRLAEEMGLISQQKEACQCLYDAHKAMGRSNDALVYLEKIGGLDKQLNKEETAKQLERMEFQQVMLQDSIIKAEEARLVQEAHQEEVRRNTRTRNVLAVSGGFFVLLAGGFYSRARYMRRSRAVLQVEKDRSENLLLNILPAEIAEELKQKGRCEARDFDLVSILFTDFKGFTEHSATMSAAELVSEINHCFEAFDGIMAKYGIEKIKTIGDAYMAAGGLPVPTEDSVKNTVLAALEMQRFIKQRKAHKDALGEPAFEMRVGIHTGPVVAGIVGVKKFQYDIWGDTVNTASRMESHGVVGQVNISEATYALLKNISTPNGAPLFQFEARGHVSVKGKGEMDMFIVQENQGGLVDLEERQIKSTSA
jgi:adenylate cyclase